MLLSPHRGALTAARHTPWLLKTVASALAELSLGRSYAAVSLEMRAQRRAAEQHLRDAHGLTLGTKPAVPVPDPFAVEPTTAVKTVESNERSRATSERREQGQRAWHLAADLVEQYSPLMLTTALKPVLEREGQLRVRNDGVLEADAGAVLDEPVVYILDEKPIKVSRRRKRAEDRFQASSWSLLVVIEVVWKRNSSGVVTTRENRLRLVRAYPVASAAAWKLVFDELGTRPDFVVSDSASAILNAAAQYWGPQTRLIPSLYHLQANVRAGLLDLRGSTITVQGRKTLKPELAKHLDALHSGDVLSMTPGDWSTWWDDLTGAVAGLHLPTTKVLEHRKLYEERINAARPLLLAHPNLPASTGAVETLIRLRIEPFLLGRVQLMRNLARTNYLFDLAVARDRGVFGDLDKVTQLLRSHNEAAGGWAPAPRTLSDTQPPRRSDGTPAPSYSSLLNTLLVPALAKKRLAPPPPPPARTTATRKKRGATS